MIRTTSLGRLCGLALIALFAYSAGPTAQAATLKIACSGLGQEMELCKGTAQAWAARGGHTVEVVSTPNDGSERLALFQQLLAAGSDRIDVLQVDVAQVGLLASHLLDLKPHAKGVESQHFPGMVSNGVVAGKLVAMPWFIDAGLLYYRKDLLQKYGLGVPATWDELKASAQKIQDGERQAGNDRMWGYVWQGRSYEGLTCNALEWLASHGGGTIVDAGGKVTVGNPGAVRAFATMAGFVGTVSPKAVLNYGEEEARGPFQSGHAAFMRNWPYAWAAAQTADSPVRDKVGVAVLPKGTGPQARHAATLGGQELAVSRYSKQPALAAELVLHLTSAQVQKERALKASYNPTLPALYQDGDVLKANPFMSALAEVFTNAVPRPTSVTGARYNQVSSEFHNAVHAILSGSEPSEQAVAALDRRLKRLSRGGKW
jgi:trehalose/maltose transport system substrate-binding protein